MEQMFKTILEISLYSSLVMLFVLFIRRIFKNNLSHKVMGFLWLVVIARLLLPVALPSPIHIDGLLPEKTIESEQETQTDDRSDTQQSISYDIQTPVMNDGIANVMPKQAIQHSTEQPQPTLFERIAEYVKNINIYNALFVFWIAGVLVFAFRRMVISYSFKKRILNCKKIDEPSFIGVLERAKSQLGVKREVSIYECEYVDVPVLYGFLNPKILIPKSYKLGDEQLFFVLLHEASHIKRKDILKNHIWIFTKILYWFNPIVHISYKEYLEDVEISCDENVIRSIKYEQKSTYAQCLIDVARLCKTSHKIPLTVSFGGEKTKLTRRIETMFKRRTRTKSAAAISILLAAIIVVACFTTACQPTPVEEVIIGKGDDLSDLIQSTPDASVNVSPSDTSTQPNDALYTELFAPKHWTFETTAFDDKLNITADVDVELPSVSQLPAATATLSEFTQEHLDKIAEVLCVGDAVWRETDILTKEMIEEKVVQERATLARLKSENNPGEAVMIEKTENSIKNFEQQYDNAPKASDLQAIDFNIGEISYGDDRTAIGFKGITQANDQSFCFTARSAINGQSVRNVYANYGTEQVLFAGTYIDNPYNVSLTREQAAEQASEIAKKLTDELTLTSVVPAASDGPISRKWGWACVFMREINGCPTAYESTEVGSSMDSEVTEPIPYEKMIITMDDMGILGFSWESPMKIESIDNSNVEVLPFDEIKERAIEQLAQKWIYQADADPGCTAKITKVELGLMRIAKVDSNDYYYIPVWNFFAEFNNTDDFLRKMEELGKIPSNKSEDAVDAYGNPTKTSASFPQAWGAVTVNALDGSIIDRNLGY